ncbi:MAG TPA: tripartite tricarboxylate transporter substrate-binding protein [Beijerinckiaceae bacterium]|jgi:tripartite-type tricarboxylate transporter receptor subunit TctC
MGISRFLTSAVVSLALAAGIAATRPATAQDAEAAFYQGKTVRIVVGYGAGGGYDIYARMIAPYLAKVLGTTVIVENQPGAGGLTALANLYNAPPDGLNMMLVNGAGAALAQLVGHSGVRYDLAKVGHLGTVSASPWIWLVGPNSSVKAPDDVLKARKQMMWSGSGPMDGLSDGAAFTCEALKLECRIVMGYKGSNEAAFAVTKGEMDAIYVSDTSANNYVKAGQNRAIATMARERSRFFPDIPTIFEAVKLDAEQEWLFDFRATLENLGRIIVTPPNLPPARLAYLQAAVKKALTDPALIAEGEKSQRYIDFVDAETTRKSTMKVVADVTPEQKERVKKIVTVKQ